MLRPYSVTVFQDPEKYEIAQFFYDEIVGCTETAEIGSEHTRFFPNPVFLAIAIGDAPESDEEKPSYGGFTGIQLNFVPASDLNPIVARQRASGLRQPEPRELEGQRLLSVHDPSGNIIMCVGYDDPPAEPTVDDAVGSITIFVEHFKRSRAFYVDQLELPVRAEPHDGLIVLGGESGTAIMIYQVAQDNPNTPIGRDTGLSFVSAVPGEVLVKVKAGGGAVLHKVEGTDPTNGILAATFADPDGNSFILLSETSLVDSSKSADDSETSHDA